EPLAVADRDRAFVLLDPPLHLLEQLVGEGLVLGLPAFEIGVLGLQVGKHVGVIDLGIFRVPQPVPRVLDGHAMAFVAVGALFGGWRGAAGHGLVHALALSALASGGKPYAVCER